MIVYEYVCNRVRGTWSHYMRKNYISAKEYCFICVCACVRAYDVRSCVCVRVCARACVYGMCQGERGRGRENML